MHRRQFLTSLLSLPLVGLPLTFVFQPYGYTIGGWYTVPGLTCAEFRVTREGEPEVLSSGVYTFQYDYPVDDSWLADFRASTVLFGCNTVWLPVVGSK